MKIHATLHTLLTKYRLLLLICLIIVGAFLRFYHLDWGSPFFFHPDERNIASSISQLRFPSQLNPHFFAYGGLPIYLTFFLGLVSNGLRATEGVSFEQAIIILRFFSATLSVLSIYMCYLIGNKIKNSTVGLLAAFLMAFSPGLIQYAHFGTFESWLTFLSLYLLFIVLKVWNKISITSILLLGLVFGALLATKVSSLILFPLTVLPLLKNRQPTLIRRSLYLSLMSVVIMVVWIVSNPFSVLDFPSFNGSITYESQVALGQLLVFYTGEFLSITRGLYPLIHIYPFLLNPFLICLAVPALLVTVFLGFKEKQSAYLLLVLFFLVTFFSQVPLFVQWTRYYVPTLPFIYLLIALFSWEGAKRLKGRILPYGLIIILTSLLYSFAFIKTVYLQPDTREEAALFAKENLPLNANIVSESYDIGIVPFNTYFPNIHLYNFYELDNNSLEFTPDSLQETLATADYFIMPSQRLLKVRLTDKDNFPQGYAFYHELTTNSRKYSRIYQTPCDFWCSLTYGMNVIYAYEGTVNIFDRPPVIIYKINHEQ